MPAKNIAVAGARSGMARARALLTDELAAGPRPAGEIAVRAEQAGISGAALRRAREELGVRTEKRGFGAGGRWLLALGAPSAGEGDPGLGWGLLAGGAASLGLAWLCIRANQRAAEQGGCPAPAFTGFPAPPGAERQQCGPDWLIVALIVLGLALAIFGLGKL